jgi:hypothetical protein
MCRHAEVHITLDRIRAYCARHEGHRPDDRRVDLLMLLLVDGQLDDYSRIEFIASKVIFISTFLFEF